VAADDVDRGLQLGVGAHGFGGVPGQVGRAAGADLVVTDDQLGGQAVADQLALEALDPLPVDALVDHGRLVDDAGHVVDRQAPVLAGALEIVDDVVQVGLGEEATHPAGRRLQEAELDVRVAALGFPHQPPLVAAVEALVVGLVLGGRRRALPRVAVAAHVVLELLQGGAVAGLEQVVQDLAALRLRVVDEQPGNVAAQRADAVEPLPVSWPLISSSRPGSPAAWVGTARPASNATAVRARFQRDMVSSR
jgi:hypothetical protein